MPMMFIFLTQFLYFFFNMKKNSLTPRRKSCPVKSVRSGSQPWRSLRQNPLDPQQWNSETTQQCNTVLHSRSSGSIPQQCNGSHDNEWQHSTVKHNNISETQHSKHNNAWQHTTIVKHDNASVKRFSQQCQTLCICNNYAQKSKTSEECITKEPHPCVEHNFP